MFHVKHARFEEVTNSECGEVLLHRELTVSGHVLQKNKTSAVDSGKGGLASLTEHVNHQLEPLSSLLPRRIIMDL